MSLIEPLGVYRLYSIMHVSVLLRSTCHVRSSWLAATSCGLVEFTFWRFQYVISSNFYHYNHAIIITYLH